MSHHIYNTESFVLGSAPSGEANKMFMLFTRELGLVRATAQGVRFLKSKLRFSLQDFTYGTVSLVRGKEFWRVTNARSESNLFSTYKDRRDIIQTIAHIFTLLRRLIHGEEKNEPLFDLVKEAFDFLENEKIAPENAKPFEYILVIKILHNLGYGSEEKEIDRFAQASWSPELLGGMEKIKKQAIQSINNSLRQTQL